MSAMLPGLAIVSIFNVTEDVFSTKTNFDKLTDVIDSIESTQLSHDHIVAVYLVMRYVVTIGNLDDATVKPSKRANRIENLAIIAANNICPEVADYAVTLHETTGGTEVVILNCCDFIMHFIYVFQQRRTEFLDTYESLWLSQPDSSVGSASKDVFLALRRATITPE